MSSTPARTVTLRALRFDASGVNRDDLDAATTVFAAADTGVLGAPETGQRELEEWFMLPVTDRENTGFLEQGSDIVGMLWVYNDVTARETFMIAAVPPAENAPEVSDAAIRLGVVAACGHHASAGPGPWTVRCRQWLGDDTQGSSLSNQGFTVVRTFLRMRIDSASPLIPDVVPDLPEGVELVVARTKSERQDIYRVENESFADHWNHTPREWDEWWAFYADAPSFDPDGWWLIRVDGEPAAALITEESLTDMNLGYVGILGVRREFRRRGLAAFLLKRAFVRFRDLGRDGTQLGVDAESPTSAVALYESVGMRVAQTTQAWALELD